MGIIGTILESVCSTISEEDISILIIQVRKRKISILGNLPKGAQVKSRREGIPNMSCQI